MNIPILKYVDILIGLSLVMVLLSTIVLAVTQMALNSAFARARHLKKGLAGLFRHLEPSVLRPHDVYLSELLLRHPLIGQQTMWTWVRKLRGRWRSSRGKGPLPTRSPGSVVQREELAFLLIEFAAGEGGLMDPTEEGRIPPKIAEAQAAVAEALSVNGIEEPSATLRAIRLKVVENERAEPNLPAYRWRADAVADCAPGDFVAKVHASFDSTMARVTDAFTGESKLWVAAASLAVALALQVDTFALVKRLSIDDSYRQTLVELAQKQPAAPPDAAGADPRKQAEASLELLASPAINLSPAAFVWPSQLQPAQIPGILFTWLLLSLGAPFWFDMLKNLLKLRSLLAKKDDTERAQRESAQPPVRTTQAVAGASASTEPLAGEVGDLSATGALG